jgi:hypothetical protein
LLALREPDALAPPGGDPRPGVTFQVSLAPADVPHASDLLAHQLRQWGGQVAEILCVLDLKRSGGRFGESWRSRVPKLIELVDSACEPYPHARWIEVDYRGPARQAVGDRFFGGRRPPEKDFRGGPYYSYFFALHEATNDLVFHSDADMLYGGGSQTWIPEAVAVLRERPSVFVCSPLPGPPVTEGEPAGSPHATREAFGSLAYSFDYFSTRLFLVDRRQLAALGPLPLRRKLYGRRNLISARVRRASVFDLPERLISDVMQQHGLRRFDFLGSAPGMWSIHPDERSRRFYESVPSLVRRVEAGDVSDPQRGRYDVHETMFT